MKRITAVWKDQEPGPQPLTAIQRLILLGPFATWHGNVPKGQAVPETIAEACPKVKVSDLPNGHIPTRYIERLEHDQTIPGCCRHPENHEVAAFRSNPNEKLPDIYIFYCTCGRLHRRYLAGNKDREPRPLWSAA